MQPDTSDKSVDGDVYSKELESAKRTISYQQIQSDLAAGTKAASAAGVGSTVDYTV